jgi:hypothetical protein
MDTPPLPSSSELPPPLPRGPLWRLLLLPPLLVAVINLVIGWVDWQGEYGEGFLIALPIGFFLVIAFQVRFSRFLRRRYRGSSFVLLSLGYFIGEFVVGLAVWFGSCLLFVN